QGIVAVAEGLAGDAADLGERGGDLLLEVLRVGLAVLVIVAANRGGDGEARRHRQAEIGHLGQARAFAAEEVAHVGAAFGFAVAEAVDPFAFGGRRLRRGGRMARRGLAAGGRAGRFFVRSSTAGRAHGTANLEAPGPNDHRRGTRRKGAVWPAGGGRISA